MRSDAIRPCCAYGAGLQEMIDAKQWQNDADLARGFQSSGGYAYSQKGDGVDARHPFYLGMQWHSEDMGGEGSASSLFAAFVDAARTYARACSFRCPHNSSGT